MAKILLIDDEGIVAGALKAVLSQQGHAVSVAADGRAGLAAFKKDPPDLVILDRDLPGMTGSQVLEEIRKLSREVRVIVLTGNVFAPGEDKYRALGISHFLSKDMGIETLLRVIEKTVAAPPAAAPPAPARILVCDDDEVIRAMLTRFLEGKGYRALGAADGRAALEAVGTFNPLLVLLDIDMPGMGGVEVLRRLQALPKPPAVIMISGQGDAEVARDCMKAGACDYIAKPLNFEYLETSVMVKIITLGAG